MKGQFRRLCPLCRSPDEDRDIQLIMTGDLVTGNNYIKPRHLSHLMTEIEEQTDLGKRLISRLEAAVKTIEEIIKECREDKDRDTAFKGYQTLTKVIESAAKVAGIIGGESAPPAAEPPVKFSLPELKRLANVALATDQGAIDANYKEVTEAVSSRRPNVVHSVHDKGGTES